jgi:pyruvate/2-oxoglutarate dehydrogenase complex dihydrolipoamide acyltransferase (E2) component
MSAKIKIPKVSANIDEVTVTRWLKKTGEPVRKGEPIAELTTDKAAFDLEAPANGILRAILAPPKSVLPIGYVIGLIGAPDETLPDVAAANRKRLTAHRAQAAPPDGAPRAAARKEPAPATGPGVRATPAARRLARQKGADLEKVARRHAGPVINEEAVLAYLKGRT